MYNAIGGILWGDGVLLAGYFSARILGDRVKPGTVDRYILPIVAVIIILSSIPIVLEIWRERRRRK